VHVSLHLNTNIFSGVFIVLAVLIILIISGCGGGGGGGGGNPVPLSGVWIWISGEKNVDQPGNYGTMNVAATTNVPGGRRGSVSITTQSGNLWLFGGDGQFAFRNDLWKFDGDNWTWVSGATTGNQPGSYGTKGIADVSNGPGARAYAIGWIDTGGNLWFFGGHGRDSTNSTGLLNDLWKFDGNNWTWVSGANTINQLGSYGTKGIADSANVPSARENAVSWADLSGNLWLFGGRGIDSAGTTGFLNDLWKFDGNNWTWVSGANTISQPGTYGTKGVADAANVPSARINAVSWVDSGINFYLFGGLSFAPGAGGHLNDLWKFDGSNWAWISGSNTANQLGNYGTKGATDSANVPGSRDGAISWIDQSDIVWLFGGDGRDSAGSSGFLNDLWKFDGNNWTWVSGANTISQIGNYGTKGVAAADNVPGSRVKSSSWIAGDGKLCLFGGFGYGASSLLGSLNDIWCYQQ
jgi:N-acetylneuraminic acid mutarotase